MYNKSGNIALWVLKKAGGFSGEKDFFKKSEKKVKNSVRCKKKNYTFANR